VCCKRTELRAAVLSSTPLNSTVSRTYSYVRSVLESLSSVRGICRFLLALSVWTGLPCQVPETLGADSTSRVDAELVDLYRHFHSHPELSFQESETSQRLAAELRKSGFEVTERVGGYGVVGVLSNGDGPTVMVRSDMDALPVTEATELSYASKVQATDDQGVEVGVMHACGHDVHMTCLVGVARSLVRRKADWRGTLLLIGQPAEERGAGAQAMLEDGLFRRFGKPDYALALHVDPTLAAGSVGYAPGFCMANIDSVDITIHGRGGHGASPHMTVDPIVIACRLVIDLQTIVSRRVNPIEPAVITVGSIHGGTKHNVIPDKVHLQLTVRSFSDEVRKQLRTEIERKTLAAARSSGAPDPEIAISEGVPSLYNDPDLTQRTATVFRRVLGDDRVVKKDPDMVGEDFGLFGRAGVPICMYRLGSGTREAIQRARKGETTLPSLHSPQYRPDPEPTIATGVTCMTAAVLELLAKDGR